MVFQPKRRPQLRPALRAVFAAGAHVAACALIVVSVGCGDNSDNGPEGLVLQTPDECNPLGGINCMTPWPNGIYQEADSASATGVRNAVPLGAVPINQDGVQYDADAVLNQRLGFSPSSPVILAFPTGVDGSNLVHYSNYADSLTAASPTVILDTATGELVEHFAELDARAAATPEKQALFLRSSTMLKFNTRYIVAIKKSLKAPGGADLPIPEGFAAILSGEVTTHALLERMRPRYDGIFSALDAVGVAKSDLVVAWDFTTLTKEEPQRDMLAARTQALASIADGSVLAYTVTSDVADSDPDIARRIEGTFSSPSFLTLEGRFTPNTVINRDAAGLPLLDGTYEASFFAVIPQCAIDSPTPVPLLIYGHGLLGSGDQVNSSGPTALITSECMVAYATDFRGFSERDIANLALTLNDFNKQDRFFPVQIQGVIDHIILTKTAQGPMATTLFESATPGVSLVDPTKVYYYGISQGAIMGGTIMSYEPTIERAALQVGAMNYSMLLERSLDWPTYRTIMIGAYPDPLDVALLINLMQELWDMDPANTAYDVLTGGVPDTGPKQLLLQMAVADDEVANIASEYQARTLGVPTIGPSPYEPYRVPEQAGPHSSALVIYDYGLGPSIPLTNEAPPDNNVHGRVRKQPATIDQIGTFFETGEIQQFCTGDNGCVCEEGACGESL